MGAALLSEDNHTRSPIIFVLIIITSIIPECYVFSDQNQDILSTFVIFSFQSVQFRDSSIEGPWGKIYCSHNIVLVFGLKDCEVEGNTESEGIGECQFCLSYFHGFTVAFTCCLHRPICLCTPGVVRHVAIIVCCHLQVEHCFFSALRFLFINKTNDRLANGY